ncbi:MAG: hypothetical protein ABII25_07670, partial [bacterium]
MGKKIVFIYIFLFISIKINAVQIERCEIVENTSWEGEIIINFPIKVQRQAVLTILPGTVVKFVDVNAGLDVEGVLTANGFPDKKITFT